MIDRQAAVAALEHLRVIIAVDGGDIELTAVGLDSVRLQLVLGTAHCVECVMPRAVLETIALDLMAPHLSGLRSVGIDDPREAADEAGA